MYKKKGQMMPFHRLLIQTAWTSKVQTGKLELQELPISCLVPGEVNMLWFSPPFLGTIYGRLKNRFFCAKRLLGTGWGVLQVDPFKNL